ncbi:transcription factor [Ancistrocladus abbreviatus]
MMDYRENMQKCQEYVQALEEERRKILVFQRELPLCVELVTQALEACKQQLSGTATECLNGQSECSEQTTSNGTILEEFIPIKRASSTTDDDELESHKNLISETQDFDKSGKKSDWLRSVQLWNQAPDPPIPKEDNQPRKVAVVEVKKNGGAFHPFKKEKSAGNNQPTSAAPAAAPAASTCSTADTTKAAAPSGGNSKKDEKASQSQRKARRCWSPELHRRFLNALQQLGGSHVATPKQIRELMKVDGLTNDEVKSHLQKYRLHTRRPTPAIPNNANPRAPQFVVVGGIWVPPPPDYAAMAPRTTLGEPTTVAAPTGVYPPVAAAAAAPHPQAPTTVKQTQQQKQSSLSHREEQGSHSDGGAHCNSAASSSSTHTSTASPVL